MPAPDRFDDVCLAAFARGFYGYGSYDGPYWFIGMEEGGGDDFGEVATRLRRWHERGRRELEDLAAYHRAIGIGRWFGDAPPIQPTWGKYVRAVLAAEGEAATPRAVRLYQAGALGRPDGATCLVELLPLPSPSIGHWHYAERSGLKQLQNREAYAAHYADCRVAHLRARVARHRPRAVAFAGLSVGYQPWWEAIAGVPLEDREVDGRRCRVGRREGTAFVVVAHPASFGVTNAYFEGVGARFLSRR